MSAAARRTIVKVCGITRREDAQLALECGADWLGFIVAAGGPREIGAEAMARIMAALPGATGVAVLAEVTPDEALELGTLARATRLQIHRVDPSGWPADFPLPCAFVTGVDADGLARGPLAGEPHLIHLDTAHATLTGGTGRTFPWAAARTLSAGRDFLLAGGLDGTNVAAAIAAAGPLGVDACSRLESGVGRKDAARVRAFVEAAHGAAVRAD